MSRLKTHTLFNYNNEIKQNYIKLLKEIILYIARSSSLISKRKTKNTKRVKIIKEEQKELLNQINFGVNVITEKVNNNFKIKQDLPEDIFYVISTYFKGAECIK